MKLPPVTRVCGEQSAHSKNRRSRFSRVAPHCKRRVMSLESLMTAAEAAGYVMAAQDELPDAFGAEPELFEFKSQPATAVAIWRPVVPAIDGPPLLQRSASMVWGWVSGRFMGGAPA